MGVMSDLHILSCRVLKGETVAEVAESSSYNKDDIAWATAERLKAPSGVNCDAPPDCRKARNEDEAIAISEYHDEKAIVMADGEEEWIIAPNAYGLDMMR